MTTSADKAKVEAAQAHDAAELEKTQEALAKIAQELADKAAESSDWVQQANQH